MDTKYSIRSIDVFEGTRTCTSRVRVRTRTRITGTIEDLLLTSVMLKGDTVRYCTTIDGTVRYGAVLHRIVGYVPASTVPYRTVPYRTVPYRIARHGTAW